MTLKSKPKIQNAKNKKKFNQNGKGNVKVNQSSFNIEMELILVADVIFIIMS